MLLVLFEQISWFKEDRNPQGAIVRKNYLRPVMIKKMPIINQNDEIYIWRLSFIQHNNEIYEERTFKTVVEEKGLFLLDKFGIPNIEIIKEDESYRIKWFDDGKGNIRRRGGNEDFLKKGKKLAGVPNTLNETVFVMENGKSGFVRWNNRFSSYHGQWYEQYQTYFVNTDSFDEKVFLREYDYNYQQLADLF